MIVVTGAAGFIASCLVNKLNNKGRTDLVIVDDFSNIKKEKNIQHLRYEQKVDRNSFIDWLNNNYQDVEFIYHLGARTDTAEFDWELLKKLNLDYSKNIWDACVLYNIPLIYASSAATYGQGEHGFVDSHEIVIELTPLNPYGVSKNEFDKWVLQQENKPEFWAGLKFFNVYGPNEYHKDRMASVIIHAYKQIKETGKLKLFRSHNPDYKDGEQLRDFIYVKDIVDLCYYGMLIRPASGLYNAGTGKARSFLDLGRAVFKAMNVPECIDYIDIPEDIRDKYQYFTEANMEKSKAISQDLSFYSLEDGVEDYVQGYLVRGVCY